LSFHFPLQPVLRLQQSLEERERLRLGLIIAALNKLKQHCDELEQQRLQLANGLAERLQAGMAAVEIHFERARLAAIEQQKNLLLQQKDKLEQQRAAQEQAFREVQRKRKTLENLRDRKLEQYRQMEQRREQERVDDLFGLRRASASSQIPDPRESELGAVTE
jgi:flagellar protein FliJ